LTLRWITTLWIVYWAALFAFTHTPKSLALRLPGSHFDKLAHFGGYALLAAFCATRARTAGRARTIRWYVIWFVIFALYAVVDELLQPPVHRDADVWDWLADMAGVLTAFVIARLRENRK